MVVGIYFFCKINHFLKKRKFPTIFKNSSNFLLEFVFIYIRVERKKCFLIMFVD